MYMYRILSGHYKVGKPLIYANSFPINSSHGLFGIITFIIISDVILERMLFAH